ncbi:dihydroorotate dehydrogenase electron transfer subunit [Magnetofaba australis]|uniref:Putative dihydroorotate oxidase B, electron transfer subunit n=1 Tax=Magnetofaba australis IT-1 TaxID=1434232 RepID=A0A1Y2JZF6_9PROT|nr:dihydroorotate dehydrogenase electron transfer subunit [Magnetofaba australis]OSM00300.1 putative dihydroorotate oxidase B, electron transfer subunit [Magnetofaba australis IT-1]
MPKALQRATTRVISNQAGAGGQYVIRFHAPDLAVAVAPGHFVHIVVSDRLTLPRPFSVLDCDVDAGTIDVFYKVVGQGTRLMTTWKGGELVAMLGPIGKPFTPVDASRRALLIGGGVGVAPVEFLARRLGLSGVETTLLIGMESDSPLPLKPAEKPLAGLEDGPVNLALTSAEKAGVTSRLACLTERRGWYQGYVTDLAAAHLSALTAEDLARTTLYVCGPTVMMQAAARLAQRFDLTGEASLEEHMACGFGGCAGCVAPIRAGEDWLYRRVCVDGPVFAIEQIAWEQMPGYVNAPGRPQAPTTCAPGHSCA